MKKIVVLGGSYLQSGFIETAIKFCEQVHVLDRNENCYARNYKEVSFHQVDISDENAVQTFFREKKCDLIISPVTEIGNRIAAKVAESNDLYYNSLDVVEATTNKWVMRSKLKKYSLKEPKFYRFDSVDSIKKKMKFPFIVKPPVSSASRGVTLVNNDDEIIKALEEAYKYCNNKQDILVEEYIEGEQFSIETISCFGEHFIVGITREFISDLPFMVERTDVISVEENRRLFEKFKIYIEQLLNTLEVNTGPCHIEVRIRDDDIYLIEVASRSGLLRDRLIKAAGGSDFNELIIKVYSGHKLETKDIKMPQLNALLGIMMNAQDLDQYYKAQKSGQIVNEYMNGKDPVWKPKKLTDAFGYFIISGDENILDYKLT